MSDRYCSNCGSRLFPSSKEGSRLRSFRSVDFLPVGVFLIVAGALFGSFGFLIGVVPLLALGLAALFLGVMVVFLPESTAFRIDRLAALTSLPSLMNTEALMEDLDLSAHGIHIPNSGLAAVPKVFIPIMESALIPTPPLKLVTTNRVFVTVGMNPKDRGILLNPPGGEILMALENSLQLDFATVQRDDLAGKLTQGFSLLEISKNVTVQDTADGLDVEIELSALIELERRLRSVAPRLVEQVGTPLTSAVASAVSKATGKYVTIKSSTLEGSKMSLHLTLNEVESR